MNTPMMQTPICWFSQSRNMAPGSEGILVQYLANIPAQNNFLSFHFLRSPADCSAGLWLFPGFAVILGKEEHGFAFVAKSYYNDL